MENQSSLEPKQLMTDTAGYSDIVFWLNSNKGTKSLARVFATFCDRRTFGNSAAPKIGACLVDQFWGLNTDRILQLILRKVVLSQNGSPHGFFH